MFSVCVCVIVSVHMYGGHRRWPTWSHLCLTPLRKNLLSNLELGWWSATSSILLSTLYSYYQGYKHMCDLVWDWGGFELRPSCLCNKCCYLVRCLSSLYSLQQVLKSPSARSLTLFSSFDSLGCSDSQKF